MCPAYQLQALQEYLHGILGVPTAPRDTGDVAERLPAFLRQRYELSGLTMLGHACLVLAARGRPAAAEDVGKHLAVAGGAWDGPVVFLAEDVPPGQRRRLIAGRVPFIVPGRQAYLPFLVLDIQERAARAGEARPSLRPATQAVLLWWIHHGMAAADTPKCLLPVVGYTLMSLSRVFDELEELQSAIAGLVIERHGRERRARWGGTARTLWEAVAPRLRDPVRQRVLIRNEPDAPLPGLAGGLDGLARLSDLAPPDRPVLAVAHGDWLAYARRHPVTTDAYDPQAIEVEVWRYAIDLHRQGADDPLATADPLSMVIAMRHAGLDRDERVDQAMRQAVDGLAWRW